MRSVLYCAWMLLSVGTLVNSQTVSLNSTALPTNSSILNTTKASNITAPGTTQASTTINQCSGKTVWKAGSVDVSCTTKLCAIERFNAFSLYMTCNDKNLKSDATEWNEIAERVYDYASTVSTTFRSTSPSSILGNGSVSFITNHFLVEVGFLNRERSDLRAHSIAPNYLSGPANSYTGKKDSFKFAILTLNPGITAYYVVLYKNLIPTTKLMNFDTEKPSIVTKLEAMGLYTWPKTRSGKWVLNSQIVRIGFTPTPTTMTEPFEITFMHIELMKRINHDCIGLSGNIDNVRTVWSTTGCQRVTSDRFKTVCRCNSNGVFAIISQIEEVTASIDGFSRTSITYTTAGLSVFIAFGLICSIAYPVIKGFWHLRRIQIYVFHDVAALLLYLIFFIGVIVSENAKYSDSVSGCIHFFQTAVISWVFVEGIHNYHLLNPIYDPEVTSALFFYNTIGWGIPAALSGSCAGYVYNLEPSEFSWMKVSGSGWMYFVVGPMTSVLAILVIYILLFYELRSWIGSKRDYEYRRCIEYYKRNSLIFILAFLTWYTGIMARNETKKLFYSYLFLGMYGAQGAALIYMHFLRNTEIAEFRLKQSVNRKYAEKMEGEEMSIIGDDFSSSYSSMKSLVTLNPKTPSRKSDVRPGSSKNDELYAETTFDGDDNEDLPRNSRYTNNGHRSSNSINSDMGGADETPSARRVDFSIYQIDEEGGQRIEDKESDSQLMDRGSSRQTEDDALYEDSGRYHLMGEKLQGQGHEEESDTSIEYRDRENDAKEDLQEEVEETEGNENMKESTEESAGEGVAIDGENGEESEIVEGDNRPDDNKANEGRETQMSQMKGEDSGESHFREESAVEESDRQREHEEEENEKVSGTEEGTADGENEEERKDKSDQEE